MSYWLLYKVFLGANNRKRSYGLPVLKFWIRDARRLMPNGFSNDFDQYIANSLLYPTLSLGFSSIIDIYLISAGFAAFKN